MRVYRIFILILNLSLSSFIKICFIDDNTIFIVTEMSGRYTVFDKILAVLTSTDDH